MDGERGPAGAQGEQGPQGATGPAGPQGEPGLSDVYVTAPDNRSFANSYVTVASLDVPAGSYLAKASVSLNGANAYIPIPCVLSATGASPVPSDFVMVTAGTGDPVPVTIDLVFTLAEPQRVLLECRTNSATSGGYAREIELTAVRVGTVHQQ